MYSTAPSASRSPVDPSLTSTTMAAPDTSKPPPSHTADRLNMPPAARIVFAGTGAVFSGMLLGMIQGGRMAQLRFRAEHAHKMPTSTTGWYLYHKSKNYHAAYGGLREGLKMSGRLAGWTTLYFGLEHMVDEYRGSRDVLSSMVASLSVSAVFSTVNRMNASGFARTSKAALWFGGVFGGTQDLLAWLRGEKPTYLRRWAS